METEEDLDRALSEPYPEDVELARGLEGDVLVLGAGGKMGPTLARRIRLALERAGSRSRIIAVSRFGSSAERSKLEAWGVTALACDLLDERALAALPGAPNVVYMAGMKFGATGNETLTWTLNAYLPGRVAERFRASRIAAFSTGNVYPLVGRASPGCRETDPAGPVGEYAQSCLGRERVLEHFSRRNGTAMAILRVNYAVEARYGVLLDIGSRVWRGEPVPIAMGRVNVIWQGDANSAAFRSLALASSPPRVLNVTGLEALEVRWIARELAARLGREARFEGEETDRALLSDASLAARLLGPPRVPVAKVLDLVARWIGRGGRTLGKPTKFEAQDGRF
ncbi:MAG: NAD-dependent epimerase/dehydratase family protein [Planctomycetes bacterium]|nr:NAD-dependent epimerase/dehydratase family protein [Planctomycetota bacterium]